MPDNDDDSALPRDGGLCSLAQPLNTSTSIGGPAEFEAEAKAEAEVIRTAYPAAASPPSAAHRRSNDESQTRDDIHAATLNNTSSTLSRIPTAHSHGTTSSSQVEPNSHNPYPSNPLSNVVSVRTASKEIISFSPTSPEHPHNWPRRRKLLVFSAGITSVVNSTMASSLPANAVPAIAAHFNVTDDLQFALPISCFLMGYIVGPLLCGPLSENYGRKPIMLGAFIIFTVFTTACAVAASWPALLVFRLFCGIGAAAPIACVGGLYADIYASPQSRGRAMAYFMVATTLGPAMAPMISGFIAQSTSWRWVFGADAIFALLSVPLMVIMPETYVPVLLERKAARMRKEQNNGEGDDDTIPIIAATSLQQKSWSYVVTTVMTRPFRMLFHEAIVSCVCLYAMLTYSIFYLYFQSYPLIFLGEDSVYNFNPGLAGATFMAVFVGALLGLPVFTWWNRYLARKQAEGVHLHPWAKQEEYRRLPLACLGGPLFVVSIFWLGWSARPDVHWIVPTLSGVPFGLAFWLIFMSLLNYLNDAYLTFAASAQGMASTCRSLGGAVLPIAGRRMFVNLGINWACSLLAFLAMGVAVIPFVFIKFGDRIRANSKFCQELRRMQEEEEEKEKEEKSREMEGQRRATTAAVAAAAVAEAGDDTSHDVGGSRQEKHSGKVS